ncbi:FtsX-like permease family protein [Acuticoccus sp. MNP-M23]|uniref:ABC transporter permease n=1 Tax=Acuticoccus sp. MNP-M23 TaxID=3072793 RepID=UPI0028163B16|nr:FtsX-like permease family protein [Acuticoccus sp. MNP-M23]WMS41612.1 FtsX-like permease family protein [Acuticoccus sp. MNP-M23]
MTIANVDTAPGVAVSRPRSALSLRLALREMRGGLRGFYVFLACIALGTGTIAAVNSLAYGLTDGIRAEGQALLGGDVSFSLVHRQASPEELGYLQQRGQVSTVATLRAMARTADRRQTLVELKGVDSAYPLYGDTVLQSGERLGAVFAQDGSPIPVVVEPSFLETMKIAVGDPFSLGRLDVYVADVMQREPDRLSGGIGFGPRVMLPVEALAGSGLVDTGSLVRWRYRVAGEDGPFDDQSLETLVADAEKAFPSAGWRIETRTEAAPGLRRSIDRFAQFLTLVGLTSLAVGGVGVANSVRAYLSRKRETIAVLRAMGASGRIVLGTYFIQVLILASIGIAIGLCLGALAPPFAGWLLADFLPVSGLFRLFPGALGLAALYGLLTAVTFAIWPLRTVYAVRPSALFRDDQEGGAGAQTTMFMVASAVSLAVLGGLAVIAAYDRWLAAMYIAGAIGVFVCLRLVASLVTVIFRALPKSQSTVVRLAVGNIHRRGALTPTVVLSLGLSLTLLVTLSLVDGNLRSTLLSRLPEQAPSFFFVDIQNAQKDAFVQKLDELAPEAEVRAQPMLRGRIVSLNGTLSEDWPDTEASWVLRGDRGITYAADLPAESEVVEGEWWGAPMPEGNEVSFAAELARELGVTLGDVVRVNVLGREVEATITNLRTVEWESLAINFVMIFSPNVFAGAPHAHLATLTYKEGGDEAQEIALLGEISEAFPTVTTIRVKDALEAVNDVISDLTIAIRAAAAVTLFSSILVLAGTLAASHRTRIYDAVILKTLGARRRTLVAAFALEYAILGLVAALFGILAGTAAARFIAVDLMELTFVFMPLTAISATVVAVVVTVGLGLVGTWRALGEAPAKVLRAL